MHNSTWLNKRHLIVMILVGLLLVCGLIAVFQIFRVPSEPKNTWLFGFSRARILIGGGLIFVLFFLGLGVFHEIQDTGRNIERLLAKTIVGLCTRVIAKMASHLLRHLLLIDFGVNVQTFEVAPAF